MRHCRQAWAVLVSLIRGSQDSLTTVASSASAWLMFLHATRKQSGFIFPSKSRAQPCARCVPVGASTCVWTTVVKFTSGGWFIVFMHTETLVHYGLMQVPKASVSTSAKTFFKGQRNADAKAQVGAYSQSRVQFGQCN